MFLIRTALVMVSQALRQHPSKVPFIQDQRPVQTLRRNGADPSLSARVGIEGLERLVEVPHLETTEKVEVYGQEKARGYSLAPVFFKKS